MKKYVFNDNPKLVFVEDNYVLVKNKRNVLT